jgi:hypothetical protein
MNDQSMLKLTAKLDAANKRVTEYKPLERSAAIEKVHTFAAESRMTKDDLFPTENESEDYPVPETEPYWEQTPFADFCHPDTFNYTFLAELEERRDAIEMEIVVLKRERQNEAIERVRAFIKEYCLTKEDVYPSAPKARSQTPLEGSDGTRAVTGPRTLK